MITNRLLAKAARKLHLLYVPSSSDMFLISYPRSGNTWLRSAIAEMIFGESGQSMEDVHYYLPTVGHNIPKWQMKSAKIRVVKTHEMMAINGPAENYKKYIYVIRDPRDVVSSHFRYNSQLGKSSGDFDEFFEHWINGRVGPGSWMQHVTSWIGVGDTNEMDDRVLLVRYEDIVSDTAREFLRVSQFIGVMLDDRDLKRVVDATSIRQMRVKEERNKQKRTGFRSIQSGGTKKWESALSKSQSEKMIDYFGGVMNAYDYL